MMHNILSPLLTIALCITTYNLSSQHSANNENECYYWLNKANSKMAQSSYDSAFIYANNSLKCFKAGSNKKGEADALNVLGTLYGYKSDLVTGTKYYLDASKIYAELGIENQEYVNKRLIALYYQRSKKYNKAKDLFFEALAHYRETNKAELIAHTCADIGLLYTETKEFDSALYFLNEAYQHHIKADDKYLKGILTNNLGDIYRAKKMYDKAILHYTESIEICKEINDLEGSVWPMNGLAYVYIMQGNFIDAENLLRKAREISKILKVPYLLIDNYSYTSLLDSARQNYKMAYQWYKAYDHLNDSLISAQNSKLVHEMNIRFDSDQKDSEIHFLNQQKKTHLALIQQQRYLNMSIITIAILGALLLFGLYRRNLLLKQKSEILAEQSREKTGMINIVAHDLKAPLNNIKGLLDLMNMTSSFSVEQQEYVNHIKQSINQGNHLIRDLLDVHSFEHEGSKIEPEEIDIKKTIHEWLQTMNALLSQKNQKLLTQVEINDGLKIITDRYKLIRILDNLLTNASKFSDGGKDIYFGVAITNNMINFSIKDQGPGISEEDKKKLFKRFQKLTARPTAGESSSGLGLSIVHVLLSKLGGCIKVNSKLGEGAEFVVSLPIDNSAMT